MSEFRKYIKIERGDNRAYIPLEKITFVVTETDYPEQGVKGKSLQIKFDDQTVDLGQISHSSAEEIAIYECLARKKLLHSVEFK